MEWEKEADYVPTLILRGTDWGDIADSIKASYPQNEREIRDVKNTAEYLKSPETDSVSTLFNEFFEVDYDQKQIFHEFKSIGRDAIPVLIQFLERDFATRWVYTSYDWDDSHFYLCASDVAIRLIEEITGIYFFRNFASSRWRLSDKPIEEREKMIEIIEKWYDETRYLSKTEAIDFYLTNFDYTNFGSRIYTAKNLAVIGDTTNAIAHLERMHDEYKLPCRFNFLIIEMVSDLGKDIAMDDCMHNIYDYRCMADNGISCVFHIFKNAKSDIPFDVLADIVSTERFSNYKRTRNIFIWHCIFNETAATKNPWTKSILVELLRIDDEVKGSKIMAGNWERLYKEQFEANFRVCDFSLYKMNELFPEMKISADWDNRASMDEEIKRIIEKENGGNKND